jgi:hypothetical protein
VWSTQTVTYVYVLESQARAVRYACLTSHRFLSIPPETHESTRPRRAGPPFPLSCNCARATSHLDHGNGPPPPAVASGGRDVVGRKDAAAAAARLDGYTRNACASFVPEAKLQVVGVQSKRSRTKDTGKVAPSIPACVVFTSLSSELLFVRAREK